MDKKTNQKLEKLIFSKLVLKYKWYRYDQLQKKKNRLIRTGASKEEIKEVRVLSRGYWEHIMALLKECEEDEPLTLGEVILLLVISPKYSESVLGDVKEEYKEKVAEKGKIVADFWLYKHVFFSVLWRIGTLVPGFAWELIKAIIAGVLLALIFGL